MANLDNVRLFVIDALKKYHAALTNATDNALSTTLADYVSRTEAAASYITYTYAGATYLSKSDATTTYPTYQYVGNTYVAKEAGKGLSTEDFTTAYMTKLDGIEQGAQVNVNADWNAASGDAQILNKPNIAGLFGYAYYDTTNHRISFSYSSSSSELYNIDCSDFIIDGMIDSVSIKQYSAADQATNGTSYLFIDFNTAAETGGHTDIKIPLKGIFNPENYYDKTTADSTFLKPTDQTKLSMSGSAPADASTNHAKVISQLTVSDHAITASYTDVLTGETNLSLGSASGSGNVISGLSVSGHQITATYTNVLTADTQEAISLSGTKPSAATNRTAVVTDIVASGTKNHTLTISYANVVTSETQLSLGSVTKPADAGDYTYVINQVAVSDHQITPTYTGVLKAHQNISGKEDVSNKKTSLTVAANVSDTYYPSTSAVASYVGSLEELSTTELNQIFGISGS